MKKKKKPVSEGDIRKAVERQIKEDLPNNYLAVIASAVTLADMREKGMSGYISIYYGGDVSGERST